MPSLFECRFLSKGFIFFIFAAMSLSAFRWRLVGEEDELISLARQKRQGGAIISTVKNVPSVLDFSRELPSKVFPEVMVSLFRDAAKKFMVAVSIVTIERPENEPGALPKCVLSLTLRGNYAGIIEVLNQVLSKRKDVVVEHLAIRRTGNAAELEAQLRLILLSRPLPVGAGG